MNINKKALVLALALGATSFSVLADDLIGTTAAGKGGRNTVALDLATTGESVGFEFVVSLPKGATNVDVSSCLKGMPSTHQAKCAFNEKANEVIAIAFSPANEKFGGGMLNLGSISYTSLQKGGPAANIRGLVVVDGQAQTIESNIQTEDALLGN